MRPRERAIIEIEVDGETTLQVWAKLLPVLCGGMGVSLKEAASGLRKIHPSLNYSRLRKIRTAIGDDFKAYQPSSDGVILSASDRRLNEPEDAQSKTRKIRALDHEEVLAMLKYFEPAVRHLRFEGKLSRTEIDRRGRR